MWQYIMSNTPSLYINQLARKKQFSTTIKTNWTNWTKIHFCNLISLAYSYKQSHLQANKHMPKVISDHTKNLKGLHKFSSLFCVHCWMKPVLEVLVVCLVKTWNSWYKYSGPLLKPKNQWGVEGSQCVENSIFSNGKHIFLIFFSIRWQIIKFEEVMKYLIHCVKFEMRTALFYVNDLSYF